MEEEIDLKEIFDIFWAKKFWIALAGIIGIICAIVYTGFIVTPKYSSEAEVILVKNINQIELGEGINTTDITLNQKLITTYSILMKSKLVLNKVIDRLELDMKYDELFENINVKIQTNADVMYVTATTEDAELSANIVNCLLEVFEEQVFEKYKVNNVLVSAYGEINNEPVNVSWIKNIALFVVATVFIAMVIIFAIYFFDTTIKNKADAEKLLNLPVLAVIPMVDEEEAKKNEKKNK